MKVVLAQKEHLDSKKQGFDIITLEEQRANLPSAEEKLKKKRILPKAQVDYNIVTNNELPEHNWKGAIRPEPKKEYKKKICMDVFRDYNIISNKYWEGHESKAAVDDSVVKKNLDEKYQKTHDFNYLTCSYYDKNKEETFIKERELKQKEHGKDYHNRLPPTLKARETIVFDSSKEVPEEVKRYDEMKKNQKKRFEKRYHLEQEYRDKDIELQDRTEQMALNRFNGQKYYEEKEKGFDNITLDPTNTKIQSLKPHAHVKPQLSLWEKIQQDAEERVSDPADALQGTQHINFLSREVNVDQLPLYSREQGNQVSQTFSPRDDGMNEIGYQSHNNEPRNFSQPEPETNPHHYQPVEVFESMNENEKIKQKDRLYNPELEKHAGLYRQTDNEEQKSRHSSSLAQGRNNPDQRYSRMNSGVSNNSRLSFASEGIRSRNSGSSNKLPSLSKNIDMGNPYNPNMGADRSHRSSALSNKSTIKRANLIESGGFY